MSKTAPPAQKTISPAVRDVENHIALRSHERFIDQMQPTSDHDAHCQTYWRILALGALRSKAWFAYEYYRTKAGDHLHDDPPRNP